MKNLIIVIVGLWCTTLCTSCNLFNTSGNNGASTASADCIYAKDIVAHYCKPRVDEFYAPTPIHVRDISIAIKSQGYIPVGFCSNSGSHADWTDFTLESELLGDYGGVIPGSSNSTTISVNKLSAPKTLPSGEVVRFYNIPASALPSPPNNGKAFKLRIKIRGKNGTTNSSHTTNYTLNTTSDLSVACTEPNTSGPNSL